MTIIFGIFIWVNAWAADREFRKKNYVWASTCAVMAFTCFVFWLRGASQ